MNKITPFLWFDGQAHEAAKHYVAIFKRSKITQVRRTGPGAKAPVMSVAFHLDGQDFLALNGGPHFAFTPAISFFVNCTTQREVDDLWTRLGKGGAPGRCGWLTDKYGLSWQVIPKILGELLADADPARAQRAMQAMMQMTKLDIAQLRAAARG
jgi:predicted 3-demethylubiquinone-9 3-methyltransferase (glyoxalase superfamily)